ncbi:MAG TPA: phosphoribosyltransferase family protein [Candidatus Saccharimonadales bacterium]
MQIIEQIIATVAPHYCLGCDTEGTLLCAACASTLPPTPGQCYRCGKLDELGRTCVSCRRNSSLRSVQAVTTYEGTAKGLIARLKFERAQAAAKDVAAAMAARLTFKGGEQFLVTYIPTANTRVRRRGYDQAQLIARELAREFGTSRVALLARVGNVRQLGAGREQRRAQLANAFRPLKPYMVQNANVVLIDDVITTGSTLEAAAAILKAAGAKTVHAAVFARA